MKTLVPHEGDTDRRWGSDLQKVAGASVLSAALYIVVALSEPAMNSHAHRRAALLIYTGGHHWAVRHLSRPPSRRATAAIARSKASGLRRAPAVSTRLARDSAAAVD